MAKPKSLTEPFVEGKILRLAEKSGFRKVKKEQGDPDLVLSDYIGKYKHKIECKGVQRGIHSKANSQKAYNSALGQIIKCMEKEGIVYGIAFPDVSFFRKKVLEELPVLARKRLDLYIYFVDKKGYIHSLTPSAKKLRIIKKLPSSYRKKYPKI